MSGLDLLEHAISAHGADALDAASEIRVDMSVTGWAFAMRFKRGALAHVQGSVIPGAPHSALSPYPRSGMRGVFDHDSVRIERDDGTVVEQRADARHAIKGLRRNLWWDDLDLLYFAGYALWNYMTTPYLLQRPGFELEEREPWEENGERWRRLHVRFPAEIPTHSREQDFYFDAEGKLRRLDYTAEVFGSWAKAAHYCHEHRRFDGLLVPTRRRVVPRKRNGRPRPGPTLVSIEIHDVALAPASSS